MLCYASWSRETAIGSPPLQEEDAVPALLFKFSLLRQGRKLQNLQRQLERAKEMGSVQLGEPEKQLGSAKIRDPGLRNEGKKSFLELEWNIELFLTEAEHW